MSAYRRPAIDATVYRDARGDVIRYGERWGIDGPPEGSYSRVSNLERFRPLQTIADALIAHLGETFDVTVDDDPAHAAELLQHRDDVARAVRVTPTSGAPLTFVFTTFPSVFVHAGELVDLLFPFCGCDACDESVANLADELEWQVLAVSAGGLHESIDDAGLRVETLLEDPQHGSTRWSRATQDLPAVRIERARKVLAGGEHWGAWPRR
ncbi:MAG: DUF6226 family protein [Protaetiibacter sp.]